MKKNPLQFTTECPPYEKLWQILDEHIDTPRAGLSVQETKHHLFVYLLTSPDYKTDKTRLLLPTTRWVAFPKSITYDTDMLPHLVPLLYPSIAGLPDDLALFIYTLHPATRIAVYLVIPTIMEESILNSIRDAVQADTTLHDIQTWATFDSVLHTYYIHDKHHLRVFLTACRVYERAIPPLRLSKPIYTIKPDPNAMPF